MPLVATGLKATPTPPAALLTALARIVRDDPRGIRWTRHSDAWSSTGCAARPFTARLAPSRCAAWMRWQRQAPRTRRAAAAGAGRRRLARGVADARDCAARPGAAGMDAADLRRRAIAARAGPRMRAPSAGAAAHRACAVAASRRAAAHPGEMTSGLATPGHGGGFDVRTHSARGLRRAECSPAKRRRAVRPPRSRRSPSPFAPLPSPIADATQRDGFDLCTLTHCQVLREPSRRARRGGRDGRAGADVAGRAGAGLLHGLMRRDERAAVGRLARRQDPPYLSRVTTPPARASRTGRRRFRGPISTACCAPPASADAACAR